MKAEVTMSEIWRYPGVADFFLFDRSIEKLRLLFAASINEARTMRIIDDRFETVDDMNQWFFDEDLETIKRELMKESRCPLFNEQEGAEQ